MHLKIAKVNMMNQNDKFYIIEEYYTSHYDEIKGFVGKAISYAHQTEDIVQNIFVRLLTLDKMITPLTMPSLVYTVARNLIYDYWRHKRIVDEFEHFIVHRGSLRDIDPLSVYSAKEIEELMERSIARLKDKQRIIYQMNLHEGMQVAEISKRLHLTSKCVEHRLGAARKEIRQYMRRMMA